MVQLEIIIEGLLLGAFAKIVTQRYRFDWWDGCFVAWAVVTAFVWPNTAIMLLVPGVMILIGGPDQEVIDIKATVVLSFECTLILLIVSHFAALFAKMIGQTSWQLGLTMILGIAVGGLLALIYRPQKTGPGLQQFKLTEAVLAVVTLLIVYEYLNFTGRNYPKSPGVLFDLVFFTTVSLIVIWLQWEHHQMQLKTATLTHQQELLVSNGRYTDEVEAHYDQLRRFRHDYQNMLLSLDEYLATDDIDGLKKYYYQALRPVNSRLTSEKYALEDLGRLQVKEIKSLVFNKLSAAQDTGTKVRFECRETVPTVGADPVSLVIALGIVLDNAVTATAHQPDSVIEMAIMTDDYGLVFAVRNTIHTELPPLWQLKRKNFSTNGPGRGLGLTNLQAIIDQHAAYMLDTAVTAHHFTQRITVKLGDHDD